MSPARGFDLHVLGQRTHDQNGADAQLPGQGIDIGLQRVEQWGRFGHLGLLSV